MGYKEFDKKHDLKTKEMQSSEKKSSNDEIWRLYNESKEKSERQGDLIDQLRDDIIALRQKNGEMNLEIIRLTKVIEQDLNALKVENSRLKAENADLKAENLELKGVS